MTTVTFTTPGGGSWVVPAGVTSIAFDVLAGGAAGSGGASVGGGGYGGGACSITLTVLPGGTVYYSVAGPITGTTGDGGTGNNSWINIVSNAQPTLAIQGCYATGGSITVAGGGFLGSTNFTGGNATRNPGEGGGGGAGTTGNGSNASTTTGGAGGAGGGGTGGNGGGGGAGGAPGAASGGGGGSGGGGAGSSVGGDGARGQLAFTYTAFTFVSLTPSECFPYSKNSIVGY